MSGTCVPVCAMAFQPLRFQALVGKASCEFGPRLRLVHRSAEYLDMRLQLSKIFYSSMETKFRPQ